MNFLYLRSYMLKLFAFCLDSCIVYKGEKFVHALGTWECLEGAPFGSGKFWAVWCRAGLTAPRAVRWSAGGLTAWRRRSNRPWAEWAVFCSLLHSRVALLHLFTGSVLWLRGSLHMCRGSSLWCLSFGLVVCTLWLSVFLSRMCRAVALA
jgi:hypothetical protein